MSRYILASPCATLILSIAPVAAQTFEARGSLLPVPQWAEDLICADFDGDGREEVLDVVVLFSNRALYLMEAEPTGTWTATSLTPHLIMMHDQAAVDLDGDGRVDIAVVEEVSGIGSPIVYIGTDEGQPFDRALVSPTLLGSDNRIVAPDFDGDGDLDLVAMSLSNAQLLTMRNDGMRQFTNAQFGVSSVCPRALEALDLDLDGFDDLVGLFPNGLGWRRSLGDGHFDPFVMFYTGPLTYALRLEAHDMDGDGDMDLVCPAAFPGGSTSTSYWLEIGPGPTAVVRSDHLTAPGALE